MPSGGDGELETVPAVLVDGVGDELDDARVLAVVLGDAADERTVATEEAVLTSLVDGAEGAEGEADTSIVGEPLAHGLKCSLAVAADLATSSERGCVACDLSCWSVCAGSGGVPELPRGWPERLRDVSMRCCVHSRCSLARVRGSATSRALAEWLFANETPPHGRVLAPVTADYRQAHRAVRNARSRREKT